MRTSSDADRDVRVFEGASEGASPREEGCDAVHDGAPAAPDPSVAPDPSTTLDPPEAYRLRCAAQDPQQPEAQRSDAKRDAVRQPDPQAPLQTLRANPTSNGPNPPQNVGTARFSGSSGGNAVSVQTSRAFPTRGGQNGVSDVGTAQFSEADGGSVAPLQASCANPTSSGPNPPQNVGTAQFSEWSGQQPQPVGIPRMPRETGAPQPSAPQPSAPQPPAPQPPTPRKKGPIGKLFHFLKWTLTIVGVMAVYIVVAVAVSGAAYVGIADGAFNEADGDMYAQLTGQACIAVLMFLWGLYLRQRGFLPQRVIPATRRPGAGAFARSALGLLLMGIGMQLGLSVILGIVFSIFPQVGDSYTQTMEDSGLSAIALMPIVSTVILAPLSEELMDRGVVMEFALRAVCPAWGRDVRGDALCASVGPARFWAANLLQAVAFGILHMNPVQTSYATAIGLVLGWVYWRTGRLRYGMILHFGVNASFYAIDPLLQALTPLGPAGDALFYAILVAASVLGARLFLHATRRGEGSRGRRMPVTHRAPVPNRDI